jgi:hypothetical protein
MISTLIAVPYELARLPLAIIDDRLSDKLSETSAPRVTLDRALGSADRFAGTLLGNRDIAQRGADRIERSRKLLMASRLEDEAETRREQARETVTAGRREAAQKRRAAQDRASAGLDEAVAAESRGKQRARATAKKTAAAKKAATDKRAASRTATIEKRKDKIESAADAKTRAAQRRAKDDLGDARKSKQSAAEARADADRLEALAEAKKQQRQKD